MRILRPEVDLDFEVGPALFGPDLGENEFQVSAELVEPKPLDNGCSAYSEAEAESVRGKIALAHRGGCLFVQKVSSGVCVCVCGLTASRLKVQTSHRFCRFTKQ